MTVDRRSALVVSLINLGFKQRRLDLYTWEYIEVRLLDFNGGVQLMWGDGNGESFAKGSKDETILKAVTRVMEEYKKTVADFAALCDEVEFKLYERGVFVTRKEPAKQMLKLSSRRRARKAVKEQPWRAKFYLKATGDYLFRIDSNDDADCSIELDYGDEFVTVKTAQDVIDVLTKTRASNPPVATTAKNVIYSFSSHKMFLYYIFNYGVTSVKKVECTVHQTSDDPVACALVGEEKLTREYFAIRLRRKLSEEDQAALLAAGKES